MRFVRYPSSGKGGLELPEFSLAKVKCGNHLISEGYANEKVICVLGCLR